MRTRRFLLGARLRLLLAVRRPAKLIGLGWLVTLGLAAALIALAVAGRELTVFRVTAWSRAALLRAGPNHPPWPTDFAMQPAARCAPLTFRAEPGAQILFSEVAPGQLRVTVMAEQANGRAGVFACRDGSIEDAAATVSALLEAQPDMSPPVLRFAGQMIFGAEVDQLDPNPNILTEGMITMETRSLFDNLGRIETSYSLDRGDRLIFSANGLPNDGDQSTTAGLVILKSDTDDAHEGFAIVGRTLGRSAFILPFGQPKATAVAVAPNLIARLQLGAQYLFLGIVGAIVLKLLALTIGAMTADKTEGRAMARRLARLRRARERRAQNLALGLAGVALLAAAMHPGSAFATTPAAVEVDGRRGQAALFMVNGKCVAVTANHVVKGAAGATLILAGGQRVRATVTNSASDVALLSVDVEPALCQDIFPVQELKPLLDSASTVQVLIVDKGQLGRIPAVISGNSANFDRVEFLPMLSRDPRVEEGISGAPVALNGKPVGMVTEIHEPDKLIFAYSYQEIARLLPELVPAAARVKKPLDPFDIGWMPAPLREAIDAARADTKKAEDAVERARDQARRARSAAPGAIPLPTNSGTADANQTYSYTSSSGNDVRTQVKSGADGTFSPHGLGLSIISVGPEAGKQMAGRWADGVLRSGETLTGTTPTNPLGTSSFIGEWDENGSSTWGISRGKDALTGSFVGGLFRRGTGVKSNGDKLEGSWDPKGKPDGYVVRWDSNGNFIRADEYVHGKVKKSVTPPP